MDEDIKRNSFSGSLGFILAASGSAVGLGNIWRFPYLAAKDGGGLFLFIYIILAISFGFTLLISEIAIGRKTKQSPLIAYGELNSRWKPLGFGSLIIPVLILPYYCVIGGWVLKYFFVFLTGNGAAAAEDGYYTSFISDISSPVIMFLVFLTITFLIVLGGVEKGIEKFSKIIMPLLIFLVIAIAAYSATMTHTDTYGETRTGLEGLKILFIPNFKTITFHNLFVTVMDAMGQLFYSLSVAMGVMITFGSYMRDDTNLPRSVYRIELFDTLVAFLAGAMIIPSVYVFIGQEGMRESGPGLMFVSLPKVFFQMGTIGNVVGCLFFAMVLLAAVTSSVSMMEAVVSCFIDAFKMARKNAALFECMICIFIGLLVCLGYNIFYFEVRLPNGINAQILDILDYLSNNIFMPLVSAGTCLLVGWVLGPEEIISEIVKNGETFSRKKLFVFMIRYIAPIMLAVLMFKAIGFF